VTDRWKPKTRIVSVDEAATLDALLPEVSSGYHRIVLESKGGTAGVLISRLEYERLLRMDADRERDFAVIDRIRERFADVPDDELQREIDKAVAAARVVTRKEYGAPKKA
jgi:PHD/YefM family antitoxin component YafN of YafNO toxin-antitoxin module